MLLNIHILIMLLDIVYEIKKVSKKILNLINGKFVY